MKFVITIIKTIGNLIGSFFWLLALGLTQIGNFFATNKGEK